MVIYSRRTATESGRANPCGNKFVEGRTCEPIPVVRAGQLVGEDTTVQFVALFVDEMHALAIGHGEGEVYVGSDAMALAQALETNTHVQELVLKNCNVITSGGKAFGDMLAKNTSLRLLDLEANKIKTDGIEALARGLESNATLVYVKQNVINVPCAIRSLKFGL